MAVCTWCDREMTTAESCTVAALHRDGEPVAMIPWGRERGRRRASGRCGDCGVRPGGFHHPGCDVQRCGVCLRQMITCGCRFDEDGEDADDELEFDIITDRSDYPDKDLTVVRGIPCTTALRTVIDLAPSVTPSHLRRMVDDALRRELFTVEEALERLAEDDMLGRPGALLVLRALPD